MPNTLAVQGWVLRQLTTKEICDEASLLRVCDVLHDASFNLELACFDAATGAWRGPFIRPFLENRDLISERRGLLWTKVTFPLVACSLELDGITHFEVVDGSRIGTFTFIDGTAKAGEYRLRFAKDMEIRMGFLSTPHGRLKDIEILEGQTGSFFAHGSFLARAGR